MKRLVTLIVVLLLTGCVSVKGGAEVTECKKFTAQAFSYEGEAWIALDSKNIGLLSDLITGLSEGTCKLPK